MHSIILLDGAAQTGNQYPFLFLFIYLFFSGQLSVFSTTINLCDAWKTVSPMFVDSYCQVPGITHV